MFRISTVVQWKIIHQINGNLHSIRIAPDGKHIAVDYKLGLIELTGTDTYRILSNGLDNRPFLGLSDITFGPDGTLRFTDSGRTSLSNPTGRVYCWPKDDDLRLVLDRVPYSNGICLSLDGAWVYIAATRANQVWRFSSKLPANEQPMVGTFLQLSGGLGPDGLVTNANNLLAVAQAQAGRAYIFDLIGDPIAEVRLPNGLWTTLVAFHPKDPMLSYIIDAQFGAVFTCKIPT